MYIPDMDNDEQSCALVGDIGTYNKQINYNSTIVKQTLPY